MGHSRDALILLETLFWDESELTMHAGAEEDFIEPARMLGQLLYSVLDWEPELLCSSYLPHTS